MAKKKTTPKKKSGISEEEKVKQYVLKEESKGFNLDQIKKRLLDAGYPESEIKAAIEKYHLDRLSSKNKAKIPVKKKLHLGRLLIALFCAIIVLGVLAWIFIPTTKACKTDTCFLTYANNCDKAEYTQLFNGTYFKYQAEAKSIGSSNCQLTKTLDKLAANESVEIKKLFEKKSMTCAYTKGKFIKNWVNSITKDLGNCTGPLKISVYEMIIAIYEVSQ